MWSNRVKLLKVLIVELIEGNRYLIVYYTNPLVDNQREAVINDVITAWDPILERLEMSSTKCILELHIAEICDCIIAIDVKFL